MTKTDLTSRTRSGVSITLDPDRRPRQRLSDEESALLRRDIANALTVHPRFAGHTLVPWSVAQHSIAVALFVARQPSQPCDAVSAALLHDAHEGLGIGDIPTPVAQALGADAHARLKSIKETLDLLVEQAYCVDLGPRGEVVAADRAILLAEQALLRHPDSMPREPVDPEAIGAVLSVALGPTTDAAQFESCVNALRADPTWLRWVAELWAMQFPKVQFASVQDARQKIAQRASGELLELERLKDQLNQARKALAETETDLDASRRETDQARKALEESATLRVGLAAEVERLMKECDEAHVAMYKAHETFASVAKERDEALAKLAARESSIRGVAERLAENLLRLVLRGGR